MSTLLSSPGQVPIPHSFAADSFASSAGSSSRTPRKRKQARLINPARALDFSSRSTRSHNASPRPSPRPDSFLHDTSNNSLCLDSPFESSRLFKALSSPPTLSLDTGMSHPRQKGKAVDDPASADFARPPPKRETSLPERDLETTTPTASPSRWSKLLHKPVPDLPPAPTAHASVPDGGEASTSTFLNMIKSTFRKDDTLQLAELSEWPDEESMRPKSVSSPLPLKWLNKRKSDSPKTFASSLEDTPMFSLGLADRFSEIKSRRSRHESLDGFETAHLEERPAIDADAQEVLRDEGEETIADDTEQPSVRSGKVSFHADVVYKVIERLPEFANEGSPATEQIGDTGVVPLSDRQCVPDDPTWCGDHADDLSPVEEGECKEWVLRQGWTTLSNTYHNEFIDKDLPSENGYAEPFIEMLQAGSFDDEPWRPSVAVEEGKIVVKEPTPDKKDDDDAQGTPSEDKTIEQKPSATDIRVMAECFPSPPSGALEMRRSGSNSSSRTPSESRRTSLASVAELSEEPRSYADRRRRSPLSSSVVASLAPQAQVLFDTQNRLNEDLSRELDGYGALLSQLESKLSDRDSVIRRLVRDHAQERRRLKKEVAERDARADRLGAEAARLRADAAKDAAAEPSLREDDRDELAAELDGVRAKLAALEIEHAALGEECAEARADAADARREMDDVRRELEDARRQQREQSRELGDARAQLAEANSLFDREAGEADAARDARADAEARLRSVEEQRTQLAAQVERERSARLDAERAREQERAELAALRGELDEERRLRQRLESAPAPPASIAASASSHAPSLARSQAQPQAIPGPVSESGHAHGHGHGRRESGAFSPKRGSGSGSFLRDSWATATGKRSVLAPVSQKSAERTIAQLERTVDELASANERLSLGMSSLQQERELLRRKLQRAEGGQRAHQRSSARQSLQPRPSLRS